MESALHLERHPARPGACTATGEIGIARPSRRRARGSPDERAGPHSLFDPGPGPIVQGRDAADAFRNTVAVAQQAERLGYNRFWLAEHHNINGVASSATAVLIGHVAAHQDAARARAA